MGLDPSPYTLRELFWLYEGSDRQAWMHTASINATQSAAAGAKNCSIEKYHPYLAGQAIKDKKKKLKEEEVDELVMEMMKTPPTNKKAEGAEGEKEKKEKKPRAPKKKKEEEVKADAPAGSASPQEEEVKADAPAGPAGPASPQEEEVKADNKVYVGGFPLKDQFQPKAPTEEEEEDEEHEEFEHEGKKYYRTPDNVVFDTETLEAIGTWNEKENRIDELEEEDED